MHLVRYVSRAGRIRHGVRHDDGTVQGAPRLEAALRGEWSSAPIAELVASLDEPERAERFLAPVDPPAIVCMGRNFLREGETREAALRAMPDERAEVFLKPPASIQVTGGAIRMPSFDDGDPLLHCEGELGIVILRDTRNVDEKDALQCILGLVACNDVTALRWQTREGPPLWMRGKGFDTFCPVGPAMVPASSMPHLGNVEMRTFVNDRLFRAGRVDDMIRRPAEIVSLLSCHLTLLPGTLILCGGPPMIGTPVEPPPSLREGDRIRIEIDGLPGLENLTTRC